jgi:tight adherence protein B
MIDYLANLATNSMFWLSIIAIFCAVAIIAWLLVRRANLFMDDYQSVFKETATGNLEDMFLFIDPQQLFIANIVALILAPLLAYMMTGDFRIALMVFVLLIVIPMWAYKKMRQNRLKKFEKQLPDVLVMISGALASGSSLNMALQSVMLEQEAPISQEFMLFVREQRIGVDFDASLRNMERRIPLLDFSMFTAAMRISREVGGDLGEVLSTLADTLRRKSAMEGKIDSLTAQGRMQGIVMTGLPLLLGGLLFILEPDAMSKLFTTPMGWGLLSVIVVMEILGYIFIKKITSNDV